jgi:ABC-type proline/glycine betaine transport system substrate-binding protein
MKFRTLTFLMIVSLAATLLLGACTGGSGTNNAANNAAKAPVATPTAAPTPDTATKAAVEDALKKKGFTDVTVDVKDKTILTGSVGKGKKAEAVSTAMEAGKKGVDASGLTEK